MKTPQAKIASEDEDELLQDDEREGRPPKRGRQAQSTAPATAQERAITAQSATPSTDPTKMVPDTTLCKLGQSSRSLRSGPSKKAQQLCWKAGPSKINAKRLCWKAGPEQLTLK
ncbi:hypothetical protein ACCO45_007829 [Purpureocillium lilacinum]|uniref:Uncharacterized protein n=1 Tax=Purpureocillium lilacinum TaxID=33203 RepID=A0ACC4DP87_PURLI